MSIDQHGSDKLWHYYQTVASEKFDRSYPRLRFLANRCPNQSRVLNIGAGSGYLESLLMNRGVSTYTLDPSQESVNRLDNELGMAGNAKRGYCHEIPYDDGFFDIVILTEVLEHISDANLESSLLEIRRVLGPKGTLIGTVPYCEVLGDNTVFCPNCESEFHRWGHMQSFDAHSLSKLFEATGFQIKELHPRAFADFSNLGLKPLLRSIFRHVLGRMGEQIVSPNLYFVVRPSIDRQARRAAEDLGN